MNPDSSAKTRWGNAILLFVTLYVGAHFVLSRASMPLIQRDWGISNEFIYLPIRSNTVADHEWPLLYVHHGLRCFFYPIWKLDHSVLGGPWPMSSMPMLSVE